MTTTAIFIPKQIADSLMKRLNAPERFKRFAIILNTQKTSVSNPVDVYFFNDMNNNQEQFYFVATDNPVFISLFIRFFIPDFIYPVYLPLVCPFFPFMPYGPQVLRFLTQNLFPLPLSIYPLQNSPVDAKINSVTPFSITSTGFSPAAAPIHVPSGGLFTFYGRSKEFSCGTATFSKDAYVLHWNSTSSEIISFKAGSDLLVLDLNPEGDKLKLNILGQDKLQEAIIPSKHLFAQLPLGPSTVSVDIKVSPPFEDKSNIILPEQEAKKVFPHLRGLIANLNMFKSEKIDHEEAGEQQKTFHP